MSDRQHFLCPLAAGHVRSDRSLRRLFGQTAGHRDATATSRQVRAVRLDHDLQRDADQRSQIQRGVYGRQHRPHRHVRGKRSHLRLHVPEILPASRRTAIPTAFRNRRQWADLLQRSRGRGAYGFHRSQLRRQFHLGTRPAHDQDRRADYSRSQRPERKIAITTAQAKINNKGNPNTTNVAFADALVGSFLTYTEAQTDPVAFLRFSQAEAYVMDTWKIAPRLSVEGGIRYHLHAAGLCAGQQPGEFQSRSFNFSKAVKVNPDGTLVPELRFRVQRAGARRGWRAGERTGPRSGRDIRRTCSRCRRGRRAVSINPSNLIAPRFGFAWSPSPNDRTTIRSGFGMYFNTPETSLVSPMMNVPPYLQTVQLTNGILRIWAVLQRPRRRRSPIFTRSIRCCTPRTP